LILPAGIYHRFTTDESNVGVGWSCERGGGANLALVHPGHAPLQRGAQVDAPESLRRVGWQPLSKGVRHPVPQLDAVRRKLNRVAERLRTFMASASFCFVCPSSRATYMLSCFDIHLVQILVLCEPTPCAHSNRHCKWNGAFEKTEFSPVKLDKANSLQVGLWDGSPVPPIDMLPTKRQ
jgi:hypothetical protein